jgi:hypothetical protein
MEQVSERGLATTGPDKVTITNAQMTPLTRLVLDDDGIRVWNCLLTYRISWDQVRELTDATWRVKHIWALRIVRHRGRAIIAAATADVDGACPGRPEMLAAIRRAAEWRDIPAVLTGPAVREPLPEPDPQRKWEEARAVARRIKVALAIMSSMTAMGTAIMLALLRYTSSHPKAHLPWLPAGWWFVAITAYLMVLACVGRYRSRKASQAAKAALDLTQAQDSTPESLDLPHQRQLPGLARRFLAPPNSLMPALAEDRRRVAPVGGNGAPRLHRGRRG